MFILPDRMGLSLFWLAPATRCSPSIGPHIGGPTARPPVFCRLCLGKLKLEFTLLSLNSAFGIYQNWEMCGGDGGGHVIFYSVFWVSLDDWWTWRGFLFDSKRELTYPTRREEKGTIIIDSRSQTTFGRVIQSLG